MPKIRKAKGGEKLKIIAVAVAIASLLESFVEILSAGYLTWPLRAWLLFEIFED